MVLRYLSAELALADIATLVSVIRRMNGAGLYEYLCGIAKEFSSESLIPSLRYNSTKQKNPLETWATHHQQAF
jgi:hypothetical protein